VPDMNLVSDRGLARRQPILDGLVAGALHEADHRGSREHPFAADVHGDETLVHHALDGVLQTRLNAAVTQQRIDCQT